MGYTGKIKKFHLSASDDDIPSLIGIVSSEPDYRLSLKLNRKLGIALKSISPVEFADETGAEFRFSRFSDSPSHPTSGLQLVCNRSLRNFLLPKLKNIDFLILIPGSTDEQILEKLMADLRETDSISGVFNIDPKALKDKNLKYLF
ncbi:MAG TPA: IPExxxVDY family protein [Bacteroidales bacterium]|nr:IPExxxVDY family protein [Bacteroidales bacterium]